MIKELKLELVQLIPHEMQSGILYITQEHQVAGHLCPCGCNTKVFTRLGHSGWDYLVEEGKATLFPSLGNWELPCRSHYWIIENNILWSYQFDEKDIEETKKIDFEKRLRYIKNLSKETLKRKP